MEISKNLRTTFLAHSVISVILGLALYVIPGRVLVWLGWLRDELEVTVPGTAVKLPGSFLVDPVITRVLGAALLALALASFLGWRARQRQEVTILIPFELVFCVLALLAFLFRLVTPGLDPMPIIGWVLMAMLLAFAVIWGLELRR